MVALHVRLDFLVSTSHLRPSDSTICPGNGPKRPPQAPNFVQIGWRQPQTKNWPYLWLHGSKRNSEGRSPSTQEYKVHIIFHKGQQRKKTSRQGRGCLGELCVWQLYTPHPTNPCKHATPRFCFFWGGCCLPLVHCCFSCLLSFYGARARNIYNSCAVNLCPL